MGTHLDRIEEGLFTAYDPHGWVVRICFIHDCVHVCDVCVCLYVHVHVYVCICVCCVHVCVLRLWCILIPHRQAQDGSERYAQQDS